MSATISREQVVALLEGAATHIDTYGWIQNGYLEDASTTSRAARTSPCPGATSP